MTSVTTIAGTSTVTAATTTMTSSSTTEPPDVDTSDFVAAPDYGDEDLRFLVELNCGKVRNASLEFEKAIEQGKALDLRHKDAWNQISAEALDACRVADALLDDSGDGAANLSGAAYYAINAWGSIMLGGAQSCDLPVPPFCVDTSWSASTLAVFVPIGLLLLLFVASASATWCSRRRSQEPDAFQQTPSINLGAEKRCQQHDKEPARSPADRSFTVEAELKDMFSQKSCLRVLPHAVDFADASAHLFEGLRATFGFQADSVRNQFEHLLSLWRSECSMVADVSIGLGEAVQEQDLLKNALGSLHGDMLDAFRSWRAQLSKYDPAGVPARGADVMPEMGGLGLRWRHDHLWVYGEASQQLSCMLADITTFLLVWGEAGNVRFMPEMVYFITELALAAEGGEASDQQPHGDAAGRERRGSPSAPDGAFLASVIRPIYNVVFEEWHEQVDIDAITQKDKKRLRPGFENFLPADVANYDDWNELFCDPERLVNGLVLQDGTRLFDLEHRYRYAALSRVDWRSSLAAKETKTHREVHSLWGVFASTHRIWLVHLVLFFCAVCTAVTQNPPESPEGHQPLGGRTVLVRFAAVGLIVPVHALLWVVARWQVAGSAVRRQRRGCCRILRVIRNVLMWALPLATYAAVRATDQDGFFESEQYLRYSLIAHYVVMSCGFVLLLRPKGLKYNRWSLSAVPFHTRAIRYLFWAVVLALKFLLGMVIVGAVDDALGELKIATPGRQAPSEIAQVYFSTGWISDVMIWLVLWSATFLLFASDTQLWFTMVCTCFGVATVLVQRGCRVCTYAFEDAVAKIPERFSKKVLPYSTVDRGASEVDQESLSPYFPLIWDRIVEFMRYEDKIDDHLMGDLSFGADTSDSSVSWGQLQLPLIRRAERQQAQLEDGNLSPKTGVSRRRVKLPDIFRNKSPFEIGVKHYACVDDSHWPGNADVQWRLVSLARGLGLPMPRPFRAPYFPGITVLIPHYSEPILLLKQDLFSDSADGVVPLINWVRRKYQEEFAAFSSRMQEKGRTGSSANRWPAALGEWEAYTDSQWGTVGTWASMRLQTLWRTVAGMCLYYQALQCHYEAQKDESSRLARPGVWDPSDCFTCLISMQMYKFFDATMLAQTNLMFEKFPDCLQVAFIDHEAADPDADSQNVNPRQRRRYFSCLVNKSSPVDGEGRRVPRYRIELPGYPILGDGKGDNQNHAIPFMRGIFSQCIDANQGAYFEQMLLLPNALGEFRSHRLKGGLAKRIVGFPEHITSDIGSIGDFAASAELAFGTILQRTYAVLGGRMHYGHPDIMNKLAMMQQGGVSKATKTLNLSEDVFAGMDLTLRGGGRSIRHCEYFHLAKGRDLGFNTVLGFFSKLSSGTGEQILTRQTFRLAQVLHLPEAMTFYYAHGGYYFTQYLISAGMPAITFVWLLVLASDCETSFPEFQHCSANGSAAAVMAEVLGTWFSWLLLFFLIATSMPLFAEMWMERSFKMAMERFLKQLLTLSPLMFIFQSKIIGHYVVNEIRYGGATYVATGRGLPTERRPLIGEVTSKGLHLTKVGGLYLDYAAIACYDGAKLLVAALLVAVAGMRHWSESESSPWVWVCLALTSGSWLFAPFIFNPYQFNVRHCVNDIRALLAFFLEANGKHWVDWFDSTQLRLKSKAKESLVDITLFLSVFSLLVFFQVLNAKASALDHVYPELDYAVARYILMLAPPIGVSAVYCLVVAMLGCIPSCFILPYDADVTARQPARRRTRMATRQVSRDAAAGTGSDGAAEEGRDLEAEPEVEEAAAHRRMEDRVVDFERTTSASVSGETRRCRCSIPLPFSAVVVVSLGCAESVFGLWTLMQVGWAQAFIAGLLLKWGWMSLLIRLAESVLRKSGSDCCGLLRPLELWMYSHRMARDIFTSLLIVTVLLPIVVVNSINDLLCQGCSAHQLLIYRDPGHLARKEAFVRDLVIDMDRAGRSNGALGQAARVPAAAAA